MTLREIGTKYWVSYSVLNRIKQRSIFDDNDLKTRKINRIYSERKEEIVSIIRSYVSNHPYPTTARDIAFNINQKLQTDYNVNFIRKIMKQQANLSFKKAKSRPNGINFDRVKIIRKLFAIRLTKLLSDSTLLINIDESSLNRKITTKYTWGFKGIPIETKNNPFSGSTSLIMAILSNGEWISFITNNTINTENFVWFLKILDYWLKLKNNFGYSQVLLMLDNCSYHKSSSSKSLLRKLGYTVIYLPAYSPDFAPIEMWFSILKRNLSQTWIKENINLSQQHNYNKILRSLSSMRSSLIKKLFGRLFKNINEYI